MRDILKKSQKPYTIITWLFFVLFGIGIILMIVSLEYESNIENRYWYAGLAGITYLTSAAGIFVFQIISFIRIRCPRCHTAMRGRWKKWKYCPYCAIDLYSEFEPENTTKRVFK